MRLYNISCGASFTIETAAVNYRVVHFIIKIFYINLHVYQTYYMSPEASHLAKQRTIPLQSTLLLSHTDYDECMDGRNKCDGNSVCTDTPGSYYCACTEGFVGDGFRCTRKSFLVEAFSCLVCELFYAHVYDVTYMYMCAIQNQVQ